MLQKLPAYLFIVTTNPGRDNGKKYKQPEFPNGAATYAAVVARGPTVADTYNTQSQSDISADATWGRRGYWRPAHLKKGLSKE
jgi:hypothetical protein